jgi:hypothetical protein
VGALRCRAAGAYMATLRGSAPLLGRCAHVDEPACRSGGWPLPYLVTVQIGDGVRGVRGLAAAICG